MKVNALFNPFDGGFFGRVRTLINKEWFTAELASDLNYFYFLGHSGKKETSVLVDSLWEKRKYVVDDNGNTVVDDEGNPVESDSTADYQQILARIIVSHFGNKWDKYYSTLTAEYDSAVLENEKTVNTPDLTTTSESNQGTHVVSTNEDLGTENQIQGFNSSDYSGKDKSIGKTTSESTGEYDQNHSKTIATSSGTSTTESTRTGGDYAVRSREFLDLLKENMMELIVHDCDMILTAPYYSNY